MARAGTRQRAVGTVRRRRWWLLLPGVALLASCTAPVDGYTGVTVDPDGALHAVVQTCRHPLDGATLYWGDDPKGSDSDHALMGRWEFSGSTVGRPVSWSVNDEEGSGVRATAPRRPLAPGRTYSLYGWTHDGSWSTLSVGFTLKDLASLQPGRVLGLDAGDDPREVSLQQFSQLACDDLR
ncbi:MAG: hypothetical protein ACTHLJ_13105 [Angustibacter sp.]